MRRLLPRVHASAALSPSPASAALPCPSPCALQPSAPAPAPPAGQAAPPGGVSGSTGLTLASVSTGLTPQVGTLDLPPGIEAIVPSDQPLTGDPAALQAAAAMGPVVALPPSSGMPQQSAGLSVLSMPHSASEGLPVASGSTM